MEYEKFRQKIRLDISTKYWYIIQQGQMRIISDILCDDLKIDRCNIYLIDVMPFKNTFAIYDHTEDGSYILTETKSIFIVLHELAHHIQRSLFFKQWVSGTPHDKSFTKAINKLNTWANKNIAYTFEPFMFRTFYMSQKEK